MKTRTITQAIVSALAIIGEGHAAKMKEDLANGK